MNWAKIHKSAEWSNRGGHQPKLGWIGPAPGSAEPNPGAVESRFWHGRPGLHPNNGWRALRIPDTDECLIYEPVGCRECSKGYKGRIGVYEIMPISHKIASMISRGANADEIEAQAVQEGMTTLRRAAAEYVLQGITTISEMRKVAYEDEMA